jgi:hypothetical protein
MQVTARHGPGASNAPSEWSRAQAVVTTTWLLVIALAVGVAVVVELRGR